MAGRAGERKLCRFPIHRYANLHGSAFLIGVGKAEKRNRFELESVMSSESLSTPSTLASASFQDLIERLYSVATVIDDCKWVANALHLSASSTNITASREANGRMEGVTRILYTLLWEAGKDILKLAEAFEDKRAVLA